MTNETQTTPTRGMTPARIKAVEWLSSDGAWKPNPGRLMAALNSLSLAWPNCVEMRWGLFGPRGGNVQQWRLNEMGIAMKRKTP